MVAEICIIYLESAAEACSKKFILRVQLKHAVKTHVTVISYISVFVVKIACFTRLISSTICPISLGYHQAPSLLELTDF